MRWIRPNWILCYYILFVWFKNLHKLANEINPAAHLMRSRGLNNLVDKRSKRTKAIFKSAERSYNDEKSGMAIMWAGRTLGVITVIVEITLFNLLQIISGKSFYSFIEKSPSLNIVAVVLCVGTAWVFNEVFVHKGYFYLNYFAKYKSKPDEEMDKYHIVFLIFLVGLATLFVITTTWCLEMLRATMGIHQVHA